MNEALTFDTHRLITRLTENGFAVQQAEALANEIRALLKNLATKTDIADMATKTDLNNLAIKVEGKIDRARYEIIKWMAGMLVGAVIAMVVALINLL